MPFGLTGGPQFDFISYAVRYPSCVMWRMDLSAVPPLDHEESKHWFCFWFILICKIIQYLLGHLFLYLELVLKTTKIGNRFSHAYVLLPTTGCRRRSYCGFGSGPLEKIKHALQRMRPVG